MKNFCSKVIDDFSKYKWVDDIVKNGVNEIVEDIKSSVHFALPDGGKIFDDDFKGLLDKELRLPFPKITLEFHDHIDIVIQAKEFHKDQTLETWFVAENDSEIWIFVTMMFKSTKTNHWQLFDQSFCIPSKWDKSFDDGSFNFLTSGLFSHLDLEQDQKTIETFGYHLRSLMEFLEALTCKNVTHQTINTVSKAMNDKRIRKGKLPLYEVKELVINVADKHGNLTVAGAGSYSPKRQHLRRGHIRRLEKGNIWVNSCIVGSAELGVINKTYKIAA